MIEGGSPNQLIRLGVTKNTLAVGTELIIEAYQAKDGTNKGVGRNFCWPMDADCFSAGPRNNRGLPSPKPSPMSPMPPERIP